MKRKKYKLKKKNILLLGLFILVLVGVLLYKPCINVFRLVSIDYSFEQSIDIYKSGYYEDVIERGYSKIIPNIISDESYDNSKIDLYYAVDYFDYDGFVSNVNKWLELGYTTKEINYINKKDDLSLRNYVSSKYVQNINRWIQYDFFKTDKFDRYLKFFDGDYKQTIINVNIGLDKPFYEDVNIIKDYSVSVLANKYNKLDSSFSPKDLTLLDNCSTGNHYLAKEAKEAYDKMCFASLKDGMKLSVTSSYRSYQDQEKIYNNYLNLYGKSYVEKYVATPGFSEHQTGLALDVKSMNSNIFESSMEYKWMVNNSYKYGFILRYTENKKDITGYNSEVWHFRYVGVEAAKYIYENNITYDEYYVMFLDN